MHERSTNRLAGRVATGALLALSALLPASALAGWEIHLKDGGKIVAEGIKEDGEKVIAYRPMGAVELQRSAIESIRKTDDEPAAKAAAPAARPAAKVPPAEVASVQPPTPRRPGPSAEVRKAAAAAAEAVPTAEAAAKADAVTMTLIRANRDLQFARNRGDDPKEIERRRKEIEAIQAERDALDERARGQ